MGIARKGNENLALWAIVDDVIWVLQQICGVSTIRKQAQSQMEASEHDKWLVFIVHCMF